MMRTLWQDIRYGLRMMRAQPGLTVVAALSLGLGIGANTAIFGLIDAVLLRPVQTRNPEQLVALYTTGGDGAGYRSLSYADYAYYRDHQQTLSGLAAWARIPVKLRTGDQTEQLGAELVTGNFFSVLGLNGALGRLITPADDQPAGTQAVVVISHRLWHQRFNSDPNLIGRTVDLGGHTFTVVGVAPATFSSIVLDWGKQPDLWLPLAAYSQVLPTGGGVDLLRDRDARWLLVVGRLKDGERRLQSEAEMKTLSEQLRAAFPQHNAGRVAVLLPVSQARFWPGYRQEIVRLLAVLETIAALVLLIACFNVANLLLVRSAARRRETAVRLALGAGRGRLVRQWLTESLLLALAGAGAGLLVARWLTQLLSAFQLPFRIPLALDLRLDYRVLGFTLLATLATVIIFGLAPAWQAARTDLVSSLKENPAFGAGGVAGRVGVRNWLVIAQVALSLIALVSAGLLVRSLWHLRRINLGFEAERVLLVQLNLDPQEYPAEKGLAFYRQALERVGALPGVEAASLTKNVPLNTVRMKVRAVRAEGSAPAREQDTLLADPDYVSPGYFRTLGIRLLRGREFGEQDGAGGARVVIINQTLAERLWPHQDALGRRLSIGGEEGLSTVVGVAPDVKYRTLWDPPQAYLYFPLFQHYLGEMTLQARTAGDPLSAAGAVRRALSELDRHLFISDLSTINLQREQALSQPRMAATFSGVFGVIALVLATLGLYGVVAYTVSRRTREIGIRMALGAGRRDVLRLVVGQGMRLALIGVVAGLAAALALTRVMASLLYGVSATDPATFALVAVLLVGVALVACYLPARRAARVDPMVALRYE